MPQLTINLNKHGQEDRWNSVGWTSMPGRRFPAVRALPTGAITAFRRRNWINIQTPIPALSLQRHFKHSSWMSVPSMMDHGVESEIKTPRLMSICPLSAAQPMEKKKHPPKDRDNTVLKASKRWGPHSWMYLNCEYCRTNIRILMAYPQ